MFLAGMCVFMMRKTLVLIHYCSMMFSCEHHLTMSCDLLVKYTNANVCVCECVCVCVTAIVS